MRQLALRAGLALLGAATSASDAQPRISFNTIRPLIAPQCENRHVPPPPTWGDVEKPYVGPTKEQLELYDKQWKAYEEVDEDCYVWSPASNQYVLIETEKAARARLAAEPELKIQFMSPQMEAQMKELWGRMAQARQDQPAKKEAPKVAPKQEPTPAKKAKADPRKPYNVTAGLLVCGDADVKYPSDLLDKRMGDATPEMLKAGIAIKPARPVQVVGFPLVDLFFLFDQKTKAKGRALIVERVTGNAKDVEAALRKVAYPKIGESAVSQNVVGTRTKVAGVRYTLPVGPLFGKQRALLVEQAPGATTSDIVCSVVS